jgi:diguanylate cyclase (GGDEF)-like protein
MMPSLPLQIIGSRSAENGSAGFLEPFPIATRYRVLMMPSLPLQIIGSRSAENGSAGFLEPFPIATRYRVLMMPSSPLQIIGSRSAENGSAGFLEPLPIATRYRVLMTPLLPLRTTRGSLAGAAAGQFPRSPRRRHLREPAPPTVLIVEDEPIVARVLQQMLVDMGYDAFATAASSQEAMTCASAKRPDLVLMDIRIEGLMDGIQTAAILRETFGSAVIYLTAHADDAMVERAKKTEPYGYLLKPVRRDELRSMIEVALYRRDLDDARGRTAELESTLARQAAELSSTNSRLLALTDLNLQFASERDPRLLLGKVCESARNLIGARFAVLVVTECTNPDSVFCATSGIEWSEPASPSATPPLREGHLGRVYGQGITWRARCSELGASVDVFPAGYPAAQAYLAVPICSLKHTYGWLCLADKLGANEFTFDDERMLGILAGQVGRIYENDTLYQDVQLHAAQLQVEMDEREVAAARLMHAAYYDELTGLANRTLFLERLARNVSAAGLGAKQFLVVVAEVERFETINDNYGRIKADALLKEIADRFCLCIGDQSAVARVGPSHFAAIIPFPGGAEGIIATCEHKYQAWLGAPFSVDGGEMRVFATEGIALFPHDGSAAELLLKNAESALKRAKASGDKFVFFTKEISDKAAERLSLETQLRRALANQELDLHYQPKVDLDSRAIVGVEALMRWQNAVVGTVPPVKFIAIMEETGMIVEAGAWALRHASEDHAAWVKRGLHAPRIAVNVSSVQVRRADFVAVLIAAITRSAHPGGQRQAGGAGIDIEVTESLLLDHADSNIEKLKAIRRIGVKIGIDDFGTGYSSLSYLAKLPLDHLKIDRSFIAAMMDDPAIMTLVSTMITLAHSLKLQVIAEGVELEEQAKILRLLRCDQMQGYLVSKALPFEAMTKLLADCTPHPR